MGLLDSIGQAISKAIPQIKSDVNALSAEQVRAALLTYLGGGLVVPEDNTKSYIENGYNANLVVNNAVRHITSKGSAIPVRIERTLEDGTKEYLTSHWALDLLKKPNPIMDYREFAEQSVGFYLLTGNWYGYMIKPTTRKDGRPIEMYNLPSQYMEIVVKGSVAVADIDYYQLNDISEKKFDKDNIIHWRTPNYNYENGEWLYGISPLKAGLQILNVNNSNETAQAKQSQNLGALGLLMHDHDNKGNPPTRGQLRDIQNNIQKKVMGAENRGRVVATAMMYKWQQLGLSASDLQLIEKGQVSARQLYSIYGLPSIIFNDYEGATYNNLDQFKKSAYEDSIIPYFSGWLEKLSDRLPLEPNEKLCLDTSSIEVLKSDNTDLIRALSIAKFIPVSAKQQMIGLTPDEILDEYPDYSAGNPSEMTPEEMAERDKALGLIKRLLDE